MSYDLKEPKRIQIQPTSRCNLRCKFCWINSSDKNKKGRELSSKRWKRISREISEISPERLILSGGGEPLLRRNIFKIFLNMESENIYRSLVTNGTLFDEELIRDMVEKNWNHILFSIHGPDAELSDSLRGRGGAFRKTVDNIYKINELKNELNSREPTTAMSTVINQRNYDRLFEIAEFAECLGLEPLSLRLLQNPNNKCRFPKEEKIPKLLERIEKLLENDFDIRLEFTLEDLKTYYENKETKFRKKGEGPFCYSPFFEMTVFPDGAVAPCCFLDEKDIEVVSSIQNKSLKEIWSGPRFEYLRKSSLLNDPTKYCEKCKISTKEMADLEDEFEEKYEKISNLEKKMTLKNDLEELERQFLGNDS